MAENERTFWNWVGNVAKAPWRVLHTWTLLVSDSVNTVSGVFEDILNTIKTTKNKIVDCFSPDKKRYQKILNVPVAAWIWLVWAVETVVKPVVNWISNTWRTAVNATTNTLKSTFWSVFSAKPVSDFSFNTIKTKNWVVNINTEKRTLDPKKPRTINRWTWSKSKKKATDKKATAATATAATAATAWSKEIADLKAEMKEIRNTMNTMKEKYEKELEKALSDNKALEAQHKSTLEENAKLKAEIEWLKKKSESKPADKPTEKKWDWWKAEKWEGKKEGEWKSEIKDSDRTLELLESSKWKKMISYLKKAHPELRIEMDNSTENWKLCWAKSWNKIIVGTKNKENAPQILLHEISHVMEQDDVKWVKELKDSIKTLNERYGKQLFSVSNNDKYDTKEKKTIEDVCEIIAMYARDDWSLQKHMEKLQSGENEKLAKIDKSDAENLKNLCEKIISNLD